MDIEYDIKTTAQGILEIDDLGNVAIKAIDNTGGIYYLIIKTLRGLSYILEYGPVAEGNELYQDISCKVINTQYNSKKLYKLIYSFLSYTHKITEALIVDINEALNNCVDIVELYKYNINWGETIW